MLVSLSAALAAALCFGVAAVLQGVAVARVAPTGSGVDPRLLLRLLREAPFVITVLLNLLGFALHVVALQALPLFLVQVVLASAVAVTAVLSVVFLATPLTARQWGAVLAVCAGLGLLATSAESGEAAPSGGGLRLGLFAAVVGVAVVGTAVGKRGGPVGAALLGLVAGTGFGIVGVAARLLPAGLAPGDLVREPALLVLAAAGATAFLLYATAMQHGSVTLATATLVVTQTAVPAAVGLALLGDAVRPGTSPFAVAGFLLALGGAVALARFEAPVPLARPVPAPEPA